MRSWALVVSGVAENEVPSPFNEDGFNEVPTPFPKNPKKQQPRSTRKRSSKRRKRKNKERIGLEYYNRGYYKYGLGPGPSVAECLPSRQRNYKKKYEQVVNDLGLLEVEFERLLQQKQRDSKEKLRTEEILKETKKRLQFHMNKSNQLEQVQKEFDNLKVALDCVIEDKDRVLKENDKLSDQLKKADEKVAHYVQQSDQLKSELNLVTQDKITVSKGLMEMKNVSEELIKTKTVLNHKESAFAKFVEEFSSTDEGKKDEAFNCLICMESCVASGDHNTCSLACGHFFGRSCIEKWIKETGAKSSKCPVCQKKATVGGIRNHYT